MTLPRYHGWYLDGLLAAGQVPNDHAARPLPYGSKIVRVADDGTETIVTLTPPVDDDAPTWDELPAGPDNPERPHDDLGGPDGLGTDADYAERIIDARDAALEGAAAEADLAAEVEAEAAAPSPAYRTPTPAQRGGTSGGATDPDFGYMAQRRREALEQALEHAEHVDTYDAWRNAARKARAYADVARCLEPPTPTGRTR